MTFLRANRLQVMELLKFNESVIPAIFSKMIFYTVFGSLIAWFYALGWPVFQPAIGGIVPTLVLGLLLVFRTNTAYDRFWEGRKVWGSIVNTTRNIALQIWAFVQEQNPSDRDEKRVILRLIIAFSYATKLHLRNESINHDIERLVSATQYEILRTVDNPPLKIVAWINHYLDDKNQQGSLNSYQMSAIATLLGELVNALGASERILKTPLPAAYSIHLKQLLLIYCLSLPFQFVKELGWLTGIIVGLISFTLLGIEEIGLEIENPFGHDPNDLPLDTICQTIQYNIEELTR